MIKAQKAKKPAKITYPTKAKKSSIVYHGLEYGCHVFLVVLQEIQKAHMESIRFMRGLNLSNIPR